MKTSVGFLAAALLCGLASSLYSAPSKPGEVRIGKVTGTVTVIREVQADMDLGDADKVLGRERPDGAVGSRVAAKEGYILRQGEAVETGADSRAALIFSNGTALGLEPNSYFSITKFLQDPFDPAVINVATSETEPTTSITEVNLKKGEVLGDIRKLNKGSSMKFTTPVGTAGIRGTKFRLTVTSISADGLSFTATLSVVEGSVNFSPTGDSGPGTTVTAGNSLSLQGTFGQPVSGGGQAGPLTPQAQQEIVAQFEALLSSFSWTSDLGTPSSTTSVPLDLFTGDQAAEDVGTLQGTGGTGTGAAGSGATGGGGGGGGGGAQNPPSEPSIYQTTP